VIHDITPTVSPHLAVWPGDHPYSAAHAVRLEDGNAINLMTLTLSPHTGAHADAPYHYTAQGEYPAQLALEPYIGPARLVSVARESGPLLPDDLPPGALDGAQRLLIHSIASSATRMGTWPDRFPYPSVALIEAAAAHGIVLIGLDSPSVDAQDSKTLDGHHALYRHGIRNLEYLCFDGVPNGDYELIALPLRLHPACASPVRAILRTL
jgi:arylformamidase